MTIIVEQPHTAERAEPVFAGRSRWVAACLVTIGAALQVAEFVLEPGQDSTAARVAWWMEHPDRIAASNAVGLLAVPFLIGGFMVMVAMSRRHSRRIASAAAVALTCAMSGLAAIHGFELAAIGATRSGDPAAAAAILDASDLGIAGPVLFVMFLGGALLGTILVNIALWRSPYVPRLVVGFGVAFVVLDLFLGQGVAGHVAALAAGCVLAWAIVTGYARAPRLRRGQPSH